MLLLGRWSFSMVSVTKPHLRHPPHFPALELGRGTSTFDGMAIAGAVLHELASHTIPLAFFATHYGSLTDDYAYHPNICRMYMSTEVDDERHEVSHPPTSLAYSADLCPSAPAHIPLQTRRGRRGVFLRYSCCESCWCSYQRCPTGGHHLEGVRETVQGKAEDATSEQRSGTHAYGCAG